jgi:hypothetical protein
VTRGSGRLIGARHLYVIDHHYFHRTATRFQAQPIRVRGPYVDQTWRVRFRNPGIDTLFQILEVIDLAQTTFG